MEKLILVITVYVLLYLSIIAYYKINNLRTPFSKWMMWKDDVKFKEKLVVNFIINIPLFIVLIYNLFC
ncbi:MAG: hypothetical protein CMB83_05025 [Flammeovirgaceae bacterium]|nr:hypothetical protein [Flammeovirgaceae bacterium]